MTRLGKEQAVSVKTVESLNKIVAEGKTKDTTNLKQLLEYIQLNRENPVIQAAIAQIGIENLSPFQSKNSQTARLASYLFLYKNAYDFRGLLVLEEYWRRDIDTHREIVQETQKSDSLTVWLIYFAKALITQLEKVVQNLHLPDFKIDLPSHFWHLNARQKEILGLFEEPSRVMTNRDVQKIFKVSQITASRDLAHLTALGLLFSHGRGRSVRYTRI